MKKTYIYLLGIIIVLSSCNNKPDNETSTQDQLFMTGIRESATPAAFSNIFGEVTALMVSHYDSYASGMPSKSIKETQADDVSTIDMPLISYNIVNNQFTIDYGTSNYKGADNNLHRGKYYISTSGKYTNAGTTTTVTFDNYYINERKINGTINIKNKGQNSQQQSVFAMTVTDGSTTDAIGITRSYTEESERTWIQGQNSTNIKKHVYAVLFKSSNTSLIGKSFSITTEDETKPLIIAATASLPESGEAKVNFGEPIKLSIPNTGIEKDFNYIYLDFNGGTEANIYVDILGQKTKIYTYVIEPLSDSE